MQRIISIAALVCIVWSGSAIAQVNSSVGGIVQDSSKALIPGVTMTATNTQTGVVSTTLTNESGAYNFPAILPGIYKLTATLTGFKTSAYEDVNVSPANPVRLNFKMEVGNASTTVDVSVESDSILSSSSASIGEVLTSKRVTALPLVTNNVLDLVRVLPGYREGFATAGTSLDSFAGQPSTTVNTTRDGLSVTDGRFSINGVFGTTTMTPDLVGEVRLILTPVDAESGRGNAQVQIFTRSGTNRFSGSATWNVRNTALDPNTWLNNHTIDPNTGKPAQRNWYNNHEYSVAYGGPIKKNKTFFYALWEQNIHRERVLVDGSALTDSARLGIMRWYDGWNPQRYGVTNTAASSTPVATRVMTAVDAIGNPVPPLYNPTGGPYTGAGLQCSSVFGTSRLDPNGNMVPFSAADCPGGTIVLPPGAAALWDTNRPGLDSSGYIYNILLKNMPVANYFGPTINGLTSDGLNTATVRWVRSRNGSDVDANGISQTTTGLGDDWARKQINIKIDHNFTNQHKISGSYTLETNFAELNQSAWPNGYSGEVSRKPHVVTANFTSTLSSTLVNEARFGMRFNKTGSLGAFENSNRENLTEAIDYFQGGADPGFTRAAGQTYPVLVGGVGTALSSYNFFSGTGGLFNIAASHNGNRSILFTYGDTLSWTRGKHAFKFGGEYRPSTSRGYSNLPNLPTPRVYFGAGSFTSPLVGGGAAALPAGALTTLRGNMASLAYLMSGSVDSMDQLYWIDSYQDVQDGKWQSILTSQEPYRTVVINEMSGFVKDDWKIATKLTLNLGLRWEYYGSPYVDGGFGTTPQGLGKGLFGISQTTSGGMFDSWLVGGNPVYLSGYGTSASATDALQCTSGVAQPGLPTSNCNNSLLTTLNFFGPGSPNEQIRAIPADYNNFGPAVGFAYQLSNRTSIRGGYQITYSDTRNRNTSTLPGGTQSAIGNNPNTTQSVSGTSQPLSSRFPNQYLDLNAIPTIVPGLAVGTPALGALPLYTRASTATYGWDPDYSTPYVQNYNLSITTNLRRNLSVDIRYIGTQGRKVMGDVDVNTNDIYFNPEMLDALNVTRSGGDSPLLTQMLAGLNLGNGVIGQTVSGSQALRTNTVFNQNLINGNFLAVSNSLISGAGLTVTGAANSTALGLVPSGRLVRNGCDRVANGQATFNGIQLRCFPENYLFANPQLGTATLRVNSGSSSYHSMQAQFTLRPTQGISVQSTYTWSKTMERAPDSNTNPLNRSLDYRRSASNVPHDLRTNGTIELPFGPGKPLFTNSTGVAARLIERWQVGIILNLSAGRPGTILGGTGLNYGSSTSATAPNIAADVVGDFSVRNADLYFDGANSRASLFGKDNPYITVTDPQCPIPANLPANTYPSSLSCQVSAVAQIVPAGTAGAQQYGTNADGSPRYGVIVLQNPKPGTQGTLGQMTFEMPGTYRFDANLSKTFRITESKSLQLRLDASNVLNHPNPLPAAGATISINSTSGGDFGYLTNAKTGTRTFQGQLRLTF